ncbi:MAG: hypothetical protein IJI11_00185 [Mogibacterium sp.]|nr:hypothetical protein [Mogibacterium sp.]
MQKKVIAVIIAILVIAAGILAFVNRGGDENKAGMVIISDDRNVTVAWDAIDAETFEGDLVNGKGETSHHEFTGAELVSILEDNDVEVERDAEIKVTSEDNYSAELTGAELLESGKVYVALTDNGEMIEGIEGGQGAQLLVFGDPNSKRAVRYMKTVEVDD